MPSVSDIARTQKEVVKIEPDESVARAAEVMKERSVGSLIVSNGNSPVGIITDRDIITRVTAEHKDPDDVLVEDAMTDELITVQSSDDISDLIDKLGEHGIRRMPIVDDDGIAGIIALDDIVMLLAVELQSISGEMQSISSVIQSESPPWSE